VEGTKKRQYHPRTPSTSVMGQFGGVVQPGPVLAGKEELGINTGKICVGPTDVYELVNLPRRKVGA